MRYGVKPYLLAAVLVVAATLGSVYSYSINAVNETSLTPITPTSTVVKTTTPTATNSATAGGNSQPTTAVVKPVASSQTCAVSALAPLPTAPNISPDQPGLHIAALATTNYTIYGNTLDQIRSQAFSCSPIMENGERFSGYTGYSISWVFDLKTDGNNICTINNASVGLSIAQQYPSWQAGPNAAYGVNGAWQSFLNNLVTHEMGHADINRDYAARLLDELKGFPATDCSAIVSAVNARAQSIVNALDAANEAYDDTTQHGATQGAVL